MSLDQTAYCGLYCGDCIPGNDRLYPLASELDALLTDISFENYAVLKTPKVPEFAQYETFITVLRAFEKLRCNPFCRSGPVSFAGCAPDCAIRACCISKDYPGCWVCPAFETCPHILRLHAFHPALLQNLRAIHLHGPDAWKPYRGKQYLWSK